jgi:hypothetical protein
MPVVVLACIPRSRSWTMERSRAFPAGAGTGRPRAPYRPEGSTPGTARSGVRSWRVGTRGHGSRGGAVRRDGPVTLTARSLRSDMGNRTFRRVTRPASNGSVGDAPTVPLCHRAARLRRGEPCAGSVRKRALCSRPAAAVARRPLMLPTVCGWQETRRVEPRVGPGESPVCRPENVSRNHVFYRRGRS